MAARLLGIRRLREEESAMLLAEERALRAAQEEDARRRQEQEAYRLAEEYRSAGSVFGQTDPPCASRASRDGHFVIPGKISPPTHVYTEDNANNRPQ